MVSSQITLNGFNPDVLSCIANLSNDEIFTPPKLASMMLDTLEDHYKLSNNGANIWANKDIKFLDPGSKSGIFLREIVKRLNEGLVNTIPDIQVRLNHILSNQVYGIAITDLTALITRRSIYCSKSTLSEHSIVKSFKDENGNIIFDKTFHDWRRKRCVYCGANQDEYERDKDLETHAYQFIHTDKFKWENKEANGDEMYFDVIIGNPPYQLKDGGASASAGPIYQKFVEQALQLEPKYLVMITPSRWFAGGKGLQDYRKTMLSDRRLRVIVDFVLEKDAFPNVSKLNINGGVSYFLWDKDHEGDCQITTIAPGGKKGETLTRKLDEFDIFIRRNEAIPILRKVLNKKEDTFDRRVSPRKPFGLPTDFHGNVNQSASKNIKLYGSGKITWISENQIISNKNWIKKWKVLIPRASDGNENYPLPIWDQAGPFVSGPNEACSETYLVASLAKTKTEAENIAAFLRTKFCRFMVSLRKGTQDNKASIFAFVPDLPMDKLWTDEELYKRYSLNQDEIAFIDTVIRDMNFINE